MSVHLLGDIKVRIGKKSDQGPKERNEDFVACSIPDPATLATKGICAIVADGVSAVTHGKEASETAVAGFIADYYETPESWEVKTAGQRVLTALNRWLYSQGSSGSSEESSYVTTFSALILKSRKAHLLHIGDSRIYRLRKGEIEQLTTDHAAAAPEGNAYLTRAMGLSMKPQFDYRSVELQINDIFILTTDGVHGFIRDEDILKTALLHKENPQKISEALNELSAHSKDNRTSLALKVDSLPDNDKDEVFKRLSEVPFPPLLKKGHVIDGYIVDAILTESKNTQLYLVTDQESKEQMVMKTPSITFEDDPSYIERFALEEWIGSRMNHRNLVHIHKSPRPKNYQYYLLEYIKGKTLTKWLAAHPQRTVRDVVELTEQIIEGTRALHRKDTLHQDLKPDNIIVTEEGHVKIIDFGSCLIGGIAEISTPFDRHSALGTIDFSAPEYRLGAKPTTRSDLFSIAAITYFLLTNGQHPFGKNWEKANTLRDFVSMNYISATKYNPMVPLWMDAAIKKALSPISESRHESMSEFLHNLRHPDFNLIKGDALPFMEKDPVLFYKILSAVLLIMLIISLISR